MYPKTVLFTLVISLLTWQSFFAKPTHARLIAQKNYFNTILDHYKKQNLYKPEDCGTKPPKISKNAFHASHRKQQSLAALHNLKTQVEQEQAKNHKYNY